MAIVIALVVLASPFAVLRIVASQNTAPKTSSSGNPIRVAAVGDSIIGACEYLDDLQSLLGDNYKVGNFGVSGSTVLLNSWEPYMDQPEFQSAKAFEPNIVVIMLGTNDDLKSLHQYNESFEHDYIELITSFQQLQSKPQIWIALPPPIFSNSTDLSPTYLVNTIIPKIHDLANKMNLPTIDVYSAFGNHAGYFKDGVHPNSQGAAIIATEVYNAINSYYNSKQTT